MISLAYFYCVLHNDSAVERDSWSEQRLHCNYEAELSATKFALKRLMSLKVTWLSTANERLRILPPSNFHANERSHDMKERPVKSSTVFSFKNVAFVSVFQKRKSFGNFSGSWHSIGYFHQQKTIIVLFKSAWYMCWWHFSLLARKK